MALNTEAGVFLPTTDIFDRALIDEINVNSTDFRDFLVRLYQATNNIALVTNIKDSGYYIETEFINGQLWFENKTLSVTTPNTKTPSYRQVFRKVINFGALPSGAPAFIDVAHGITFAAAGPITFTRIYGSATDPATPMAIPIPYSSATAVASNLEIYVNTTNVRITTGGTDYSAYTTCYVVLEYIKE